MLALAIFMPIYEYRCPNGHTFELFQRMTDRRRTACEACGAGPVERVLYPVAVHYKGSGFYSTDYGRGNRKQGGEGRLGVRRRRASRRRRKSVVGDEAGPKKAAAADCGAVARSHGSVWRPRGSRAPKSDPGAAAAAPRRRGTSRRRSGCPRSGSATAAGVLAAEPAVERRARRRPELRPRELGELAAS